MKTPTFLAIGDIVTDAFIRLKDASVHCKLNKEECELCLRFADKVPFESVEIVKAVGNAANASVSAARLGLSSFLMSDVGADQNGKECLVELKKNRVGTKYMSKHRGVPTNYHYVLWFEDERTILVKHEKFPYRFRAPRIAPDWVYLTSLGGDALNYQLEIGAWLEANPHINMAFQPGTFQMSAGVEKLGAFYKHAKIFFCNVEEAERILGKSAGKQSAETLSTGDAKIAKVKGLLAGVHALGPKIVVITDGPRGAYASDGTETWFMPPYPDPKPPYERTGAGDAFASTFTSAIALGKTIPEALSWAPINSMSVVQYVGAQKGLLSREALEDFLKKAPEGYKPRKI